MARRAAAAGHEVVGTATTSAGGWSPLDITSRSAVRQLVAAVRPQLVINAAYRMLELGRVRRRRRERGPRRGREPAAASCTSPPTPCTPAATRPTRTTSRPPRSTCTARPRRPPRPRSPRSRPTATIVRTSLIIGDDRSKQIQLILDLLTGRRPGSLFTDEFRCPVAVQDLAAAVLELAAAGYAGSAQRGRPRGAEPRRAGPAGRWPRTASTRPAVPTCTIAEGGLGPRPADVRLDSSRAAAHAQHPAATRVGVRAHPPACETGPLCSRRLCSEWNSRTWAGVSRSR